MDSILFAVKVHTEISEITLEDEKDFRLKDIIEKYGNIIHLVRNSKLDWMSINRAHKLDYGYVIKNNEIKRKNKYKAFEMKNCELNLIDTNQGNGFCEGEIKYYSEEDLLINNNIHVSTNVKAQDFIKLGFIN